MMFLHRRLQLSDKYLVTRWQAKRLVMSAYATCTGPTFRLRHLPHQQGQMHLSLLPPEISSFIL